MRQLHLRETVEKEATPQSNHSIQLLSFDAGNDSDTYVVKLPKGTEINHTELITRLDNGNYSLNIEAGRKVHFGGKVIQVGHTYHVIVYTRKF